MRAVRVHEISREAGPEQFRVDQVDDPKPGPGEVLVAIRRAAFNRRDVFISQGLYPNIQLPASLGSDGVGTVVAYGSDASGPPTGARVVIDPTLGWGDDERVWRRTAQVLGMPHAGTMAEYITVPAVNIHPAPPSLSDDEAAAIPLAGVTAYRALVVRGGCTKDDVVLIPGIGGGVQSFVLLFAKRLGAKTIVTSSSDAKLARAKALGADVAINYATAERWDKEVAAVDGGPSLIVDSVGGHLRRHDRRCEDPPVLRLLEAARHLWLVDGLAGRLPRDAGAVRRLAQADRGHDLRAGRRRRRSAQGRCRRAVREGRARDRVS